MVWWMAQMLFLGHLSPQFSLALGPLLYFYVLKLTQPEFKFRPKDLLHFSPVLLEQIILLFAINKGVQTGSSTHGAAVFWQPDIVLHLLAFISVAVYLYLCHTLIQDFYERLEFNEGDRSRNELRWLHRLLVIFG